MSRMTDRLSDNQKIIELAKQDYESKRHTKTPPNIVPIPSKGLIYPESHPLRSGTVEMRHMTAYDEDILSNSTYLKQGVALEKLLEALIITPGVLVQDIAWCDQEAMLISARIFGYGDEYKLTVTDTISKKSIEKTIQLSKIGFLPFDLQPNEHGEFEYTTKSDDVLKFRFLNSKQIKSISQENSISKLLELAIREVNGNRDVNDIKDFIKYEFRAIDSKQFRDYFIKNIPGMDFDLTFEGEDGSTFKSRFQFGSDFFWF